MLWSFVPTQKVLHRITEVFIDTASDPKNGDWRTGSFVASYGGVYHVLLERVIFERVIFNFIAIVAEHEALARWQTFYLAIVVGEGWWLDHETILNFQVNYLWWLVYKDLNTLPKFSLFYFSPVKMAVTFLSFGESFL